MIQLLIVLAAMDLILTIVWIYRWHSAAYVRKFKHKIPLRLIEANPIIRMTTGQLGYVGTVAGYAFVFLIQVALFQLHWILANIVIIILILANGIHVKNNIKTSNEHIIKVTKKYNEVLKKKDGMDKKKNK